MTIVFDTSILIDILRDDPAAVGYARAVRDVPTRSEVTRVEVMRGLRSAERAAAEGLLQSLRWIVVDEPDRAPSRRARTTLGPARHQPRRLPSSQTEP